MEPARKRKGTSSHTPASAANGSDASVAAGSTPIRMLIRAGLLNALTIALLTFSFMPYNVWPLAYVALVPWALGLAAWSDGWAALAQRVRTRLAAWPWLSRIVRACLGLLRLIVSPGFLFWGINLYWLLWITGVGYLALVPYLTIYWLAAGWIIGRAVRRNWPAWIVLPVVWVALEFARAHVISGFEWFFLAHSQWSQVWLIQIADTTGQYGVSVFVAMVNGVVVDAARFWFAGRSGAPLRKQREGVAPGETRDTPGIRIPRTLLLKGVAVTIAFGVFLAVYGVWRLGEETTRPGPSVGIVQQAYPIALGRRSVPEEDMLSEHIAASEQFMPAGCDWLVWAESMMPGAMNTVAMDFDVAAATPAQRRDLWCGLVGSMGRDSRRFSDAWILARLSDFVAERRIFAREIAALSRKMDCPILGGGLGVHPNPSPMGENDRWVLTNSAWWFDGRERPAAEYAKMHLVPFSEYVPFKTGWPWFHRVLRQFVPEVMPQLEPGKQATIYELRRGEKSWRVGVAICYEGAFDRICRRIVVQDGKKSADILANISNDGWFVWPSEGGGASNEHSQHLVQYAFRAVENRVPVVRAVNTGISGAFDSCGRLQSVFERDGRREMARGAMLLKDSAPAGNYLLGRQLLVDDRTSMYSLCGDLFAMSVSLAAVALLVVLLYKRRKIQSSSA